MHFLVFWISFRTDSAKCNEKRRALWSSKNQIDRVLSRIFIHSHYKVRSHNPKGGCACCEKKKKRIPDLDHTFCVQGLNVTTSHFLNSTVRANTFISYSYSNKNQWVIANPKMNDTRVNNFFGRIGYTKVNQCAWCWCNPGWFRNHLAQSVKISNIFVKLDEIW